ncbi:regulator of nonsense transcripts 2-like [Macrosteles quadrilineatus]|uniref:regulator of nonsense transcripts 2-like n=1 Tax=Macrosteles quadrilineatus TaxID=74068 RepID=UPI0023E0EBA7|nr:regulator of nonsense transcripts 2-like [Macrosteles quadrilineatus]
MCEEHQEDLGINQEEEYSYLREELLTYVTEAEKSLATKSLILKRNNNASSERPSTSELGKRDPSIKKNSTFIKKVRNMAAAQMELLIKECATLNLTKYLSEVAVAIVEARIKFTDIPSAVLLCTELNCTYAEFSSFLQEEYIKVLTINKDEPVANTNKLRVEVCFYAELSLCGVISARQSLPVLGTALTVLTADKTFNTLSLILSFCKHCGADFAGLVPRQIRMLSEQFGVSVKSSNLMVGSRQDSVRNLLKDYYISLCQHLTNEMKKLNAYESQNKHILMAKGELRPDRVTNVEVMRTEINNLLSGAMTLSELLDEEMPDLPDTDLADLVLGDGEECSGRQVWEDEDLRRFYTQLPDVQEYLQQINKQTDQTDIPSPSQLNELLKADDAENQNKKTGFDTFLKLLPECQTKDMIDNAALEFLLYFNSKPSRKKLIITLFTVPRTKTQLLPLYARFIAILHPVVPEVATTLSQQLKSEMLRHIHKKDQVNLESKKKTVKFIGELVNFNLYPKKDALRALKLLLYDFTHHNVEMVCCLLDTCGCVLYAASDSHLPTKYYLDLVQPDSEIKIMNCLRQLDWNDPEIASFTISCLTNASKLCYNRIRGLALTVCALIDYQEDAVCRVIDGVLEDIRLGMEVNDASLNQRRVAMIKYLGELYNYRMLDTSDILRTLYSLISFGVSQSADVSSPVDPPTSVMRIHLVLLLLNSCALPLDNDETAKKLDYFITYFQRYYWIKKSNHIWNDEQPFPKDIVFQYEDTLNSLSPDMKPATDLVTAINAVNNINSKMYSKAATDNPNLDSLLCTVFEDNESSDTDSDEDKSEKPASKEVHQQSQKVEDADDVFMQELSKLISDSVREGDTKVKPNADIAVPLNYRRALEDEKSQFVLLYKKGNKQTFKTLTLPSDHELLVNLKFREEVSKREKQTVKKLTLDINERLQDET